MHLPQPPHVLGLQASTDVPSQFFFFLRNYQTMLNTGCTISVRRTVFKGCDFSLTLPTLVNLHFLPYSLSSVREGVCRGFSLDGHNDNDADHLFMCLFSICMYCW